MAPRIESLSDERAPALSRAILQRTKQTQGKVPNLYRVLAHAPVALQSYASTVQLLAEGGLAASLREQIAVAVAGLNRCEYCASVHTMLGRGAGVVREELTRNLSAESSDPKVAAALTFVRVVLESRGDVPDEALEDVRAAGYSEADIVEMVAHVGMNSFTNTMNRLARTIVDFPRVELPAR